MANEDVQKLVAVVEARSAAAEKQMERFVRAADRRMAEFEKSASQTAVKVESKMTGAFAKIGAGIKSMGASLAALATVGGLTGILGRVSAAAERFDALGDTATRLGTSAGDLVKFQQALNATGGEMTAFNASADEFQGKVGAVLTGLKGSEGVKKSLGLIGISKEDIEAAESLKDRLLLVADGISRVSDRAARAKIADALGLRPMLPLLEQGREGVEKIIAQFEDMGRAADEGVKRTGDLADKLAKLKQSLQYQEDNLFVRLLPAVIAFYEALSQVIDLMTNPAWTQFGFGVNQGAAYGKVLRDRAGAKSSTDIQREIADLRSKVTTPWSGHGAAYSDAEKADMIRQIDMLKQLVPILAEVEGNASAAEEAATKLATVKFSGDSGLVGEIEDVSAAAGKAADKFRDLEAARANWRSDPQSKFDAAQAGERASDYTTENTVGRDTAAMDEVFGPARERRAALEEDIKYALSQGFQTGDWGEAFRSILESKMMDAFDKAVDKLAELLAAAIDSIDFSALFGGGGGGGGGWFGDIVGSILGGLGGGSVFPSGSNMFGGGGWKMRATGGPVSAGTPYIVGEKRPEVFVPNTSGYIVPRVPSSVSRGGGQSLTFAPVINAPGADPAAITRIEAMMARAQSEFRSFAANEKTRVRAQVNDLGERRAIRSGSA